MTELLFVKVDWAQLLEIKTERGTAKQDMNGGEGKAFSPRR